MAEAGQQGHRVISVLHIGTRDSSGQQQASHIDEDMALAAVNVFIRIIAVEPSLSGVLTDRLSMIPALERFALGCMALVFGKPMSTKKNAGGVHTSARESL